MNIYYIAISLSSIVSISWSWPTGAGDGACEDLTPKHHGIHPQNSQGNSEKYPYVITYRCAPNNSYEVMIHGDQTFQGFLLQARHELSSERIGWWDIHPACANITKLKSCSPNVMDSLTHSNFTTKEAVKGFWYPPDKMQGKFYFVGTVLANFSTFWVNLSAKAEAPCVSPPELIEAVGNGTSSSNSTVDSPTADLSSNETVNSSSNSTVNSSSNSTEASSSNSTNYITSNSTIDGPTNSLNNTSTKELRIPDIPKPSSQTGEKADSGANITIITVPLVKVNLTVTAGNETTVDNTATAGNEATGNSTSCEEPTGNISKPDHVTIQNATIGSITTVNASATAGNVTNNDATGNATSNDVTGKTTNNDANGNATSNDVTGNTTNNDATGNATSNDATGNITSNDVTGNATNNVVTGNASVSITTGNATTDVATAGSTISSETTGNVSIRDSTAAKETTSIVSAGNVSTIVVTPVNPVAGNETVVKLQNETVPGSAVLSANITVTDLPSNITEIKAS